MILRKDGRVSPAPESLEPNPLELPFPILQVFPRPHLMEMDVPFDPVNIAAFGVDRVMMQPHRAPHLVQQLRTWFWRTLFLTFHGSHLRFFSVILT